MAESIKFTQEELDQIRQLQSRLNEIGIELVQNRLATFKAKEYLAELQGQEDRLTKEIVEATQSENLLAQQLSDKYGNGSLDMETGLFIPNS